MEGNGAEVEGGVKESSKLPKSYCFPEWIILYRFQIAKVLMYMEIHSKYFCPRGSWTNCQQTCMTLLNLQIDTPDSHGWSSEHAEKNLLLGHFKQPKDLYWSKECRNLHFSEHCLSSVQNAQLSFLATLTTEAYSNFLSLPSRV